MAKVNIDAKKIIGSIKPMHAVNNGPLKPNKTQRRTNFEAYKNARIPFARNHDASFCSSYGGEHSVDVHAIFPDFNKDPYDPSSYDFILTDEYLSTTLQAGTKIFYRLGSKIEHNIKKYGTVVPPDFKKWAIICEHIIMHFNEGWADGHHWDIQYWEIWNEPNLDNDDSANKRNWQGTAQQFYEFYATAATHLKAKFPNLKIGGVGSALTGFTNQWLCEFFNYLTKDGNRVPLDFFSWHIYPVEPAQVAEWATYYRNLLDKYGYTDSESILDEWNYVENWGVGFTDSILDIINIKGASFTAACMCACQNLPVDMLMYYDARPCVYNGLFDFYTLKVLKGYYPFLLFSKLYESGVQTECVVDNNKIYAISAIDANKKTSAMICYYSNERNLPEEEVEINIKNSGNDTFYCYILDSTHNCTPIVSTSDSSLKFTMPQNSIIFISQNEYNFTNIENDDSEEPKINYINI